MRGKNAFRSMFETCCITLNFSFFFFFGTIFLIKFIILGKGDYNWSQLLSNETIFDNKLLKMICNVYNCKKKNWFELKSNMNFALHTNAPNTDAHNPQINFFRINRGKWKMFSNITIQFHLSRLSKRSINCISSDCCL